MIAPTRHAASRPVWESGKAGGNETIRVSHDGRLRVKTPGALADQWGAHVSIAAPVRFSHHGDQWAARVAARRAVRYDIVYDPTRGRWSPTTALAASRRDGRIRAAITALLDHAQHHGCGAIVVENLDFADTRATGRERLGRGARGKRLRRTVAGIHICAPEIGCPRRSGTVGLTPS